MFAHIKNDFVSGLIVFLIALPLCLGIALASGAPLFSGIVAGIIGGIVIGALSGSQLSVTGPAAGLTAIVLVAIGELGAFDIFLCSVIVAGAVQFLLGVLKAGTIANYFPNSVIEGMLAGIGLTIIIKQIPDAVGYTKQNHDSMVDAEDGFNANIIEDALKHIEPGAAIIAIVGIVILILWQTKVFSRLKMIPAGLVVVVMGVVLNGVFKGGNLYLDATHLVSLPVADSLGGFISNFTMPDVSGFANPAVWKTGVVIMSAIIHGALLLICVASIPMVLNMIPKASLAAILIYTGYRLCKPSVFIHMWKHGGVQQFIPFAATAICVVSLDLLKGVGIGMVISIFYILRNNMRIPYYYQRSSFSNGELVKLTLAQEVSFLNKASIKETLEHLPANTNVIIDASQTEYIDFDVLDLIKDFNDTKAQDKNIKLSLIGFKNSYKVPSAVSEWDVVSELADENEVPKRSAGGYKKLIKQLTGTD